MNRICITMLFLHLIESYIRPRTIQFLKLSFYKLPSFLSFQSSQTSTNLMGKNHVISNKLAREVVIYVNYTNVVTKEYKSSPVLLLEATPDTQEIFVNAALHTSSKGVDEDPYGIVLWPAAIGVANTLLGRDLSSENIVELGCGIGLVSLALVKYGNAKTHHATDYNDFVLGAVEEAWVLQKDTSDMKKSFITSKFDLADFSKPLPPASMYVLADVLYNPPLGRIVAARINEAVGRGIKIILGDSPGRTGREYMLKELSEKYPHVKYKESNNLVILDHGYRHDLISSSSHTKKIVNITLYEF